MASTTWPGQNMILRVRTDLDVNIGVAVTTESVHKGLINHQFSHFLWCSKQRARPRLPFEIMVTIWEKVRLNSECRWLLEEDGQVRKYFKEKFHIQLKTSPHYCVLSIPPARPTTMTLHFKVHEFSDGRHRQTLPMPLPTEAFSPRVSPLLTRTYIELMRKACEKLGLEIETKVHGKDVPWKPKTYISNGMDLIMYIDRWDEEDGEDEEVEEDGED